MGATKRLDQLVVLRGNVEPHVLHARIGRESLDHHIEDRDVLNLLVRQQPLDDTAPERSTASRDDTTSATGRTHEVTRHYLARSTQLQQPRPLAAVVDPEADDEHSEETDQQRDDQRPHGTEGPSSSTAGRLCIETGSNCKPHVFKDWSVGQLEDVCAA